MKKLSIFGTIVLSISICSLLIYYKPHGYFYEVGFQFNSSAQPVIAVEIQGKEFNLCVDTGSKHDLTLSHDDLAKIKKYDHQLLESRDGFGNKYLSPSYKISNISLDKRIKLKDVIVKVVNKDFVKNTTLWVLEGPEEHIKSSGSIGRGVLARKNFFIDYKNQRIVLSDSIKKLQKKQCISKNYTEVSFKLGRPGVIIQFNSELGKLNMVIDTGSTISVIRSDKIQVFDNEKHGYQIYNTQEFKCGEQSYENQELYLLKITPELAEIDGVLGAPFLKNHSIYLDFKKSKAYIF